jgi:hypothetical protein
MHHWPSWCCGNSTLTTCRVQGARALTQQLNNELKLAFSAGPSITGLVVLPVVLQAPPFLPTPARCGSKCQWYWGSNEVQLRYCIFTLFYCLMYCRYHLFYQHLRSSCQWYWGLCWDHLVSDDLVTWKHLPPAVVPSPGWYDADGCFSGGCVLFRF